MSTRNRIFLCLAHTTESGLEQQYVKEAFDSHWVAPLGPNVDAFEAALDGYVGCGKRVVALASGTAAVHLSLIAGGVEAGDEVMVQSFTFCASSNPIIYLGANPVFVDSEPDSWNIDPALLESAIEDRIRITGRKPKAILPVTLYGMPYNIEEIMRIGEKFGISVLEDAAEGLGSRFDGQLMGTFGQYGILSFNGNKMITTSGGGALICPDEAAKQRIMFYATQAREAYPYYHHEQIGYNYRMSNICAGVGRGQMTLLEEHIAHHQRLNKLYKSLLEDVDGITVHDNPSERYDSNFWLVTVTLDPALRVVGQEKAYQQTVNSAIGGVGSVVHPTVQKHSDCEPNANIEAMRIWLDKNNIEARPLWKPMHKQPVFSKCPAYVNGVSESLFKKGLCLPSGPCVSEDDVRYIVDCIKNGLQNL